MKAKEKRIRLSLHGATFDKCNELFKEKYKGDAIIRKCDINSNKITFLPNGDVYTCFNTINKPQLKIGKVDVYTDASSVIKAVEEKDIYCKSCAVGLGYHIGF